MRKRILSLFMALVMLFSLTTPAAWAAEDPNKESAVTNGSYGETGTTWTEGGTGTIQYKPDDNTTLNLSKTAKVVSDNVFDITLTVQARTKTQLSTNAAAVVLVIDTSGSMQYCANCGGRPSGWWGNGPIDHDNNCPNEDLSDYNASRMKAAKDAAKSFLATYAGTDANAARWLSIVDFDDEGVLRQDWINVAGGEGKNGYDDAVAEIDDLDAGGGTNLDDGLYDANTQMNKSTVSGVASKSVIALTDGVPTYYRNGGNGSDGSSTINSATATTAETLRSKADLYTVCFGASDDVTYSGGPTVGTFLSGSVATSGCAYDADNTEELMEAFKAITNDITKGIESKTVNDPMGEGVAVPTLPSAPGVTGSSTALTWELQNTTGVKDGDYTVYTYSLTYQVKLDATVEGFDENAWHPANDVTTLDWGEGKTYRFPVPGLKGVIPVFTVKYQQGDHGVLVDSEGNNQAEIVHSNLKMHKATPKAPTVKAADGYYFTGWLPVVADTVTGDATYVAQYEKKTVITVTANSDSKEYNGAAQSVEGYTVAGLDDGYVLSGLTATVSGTNVDTYTNAVTGTPVITKDGKDVTEQFTVNTKNGTLTITKKALTITADSASKTYDGTPLTKDTYTVSGLAAGDSAASVTVTGSQTIVGTSANVPSAAVIKDGDTDVTANYDITYVNGTLTVTELEGVIVTIKENSGSFTYNGSVQSVTGYEIVKIESKDNLYTKDDFKFVGSDADKTVSGKDVGTYAMGLTKSHFQNTNPNFKNVTFVIEDGTLTINKKDVTITSATDAKTYDGKALTNSTVTAEGFVAGEGATYNVTGTRTDVGTSDNTFTYTLNANTKAGNYDITKTEGTLTVNPLGDVTVTIVGNTDSKVYNGAEQKVINYKVTISDSLYKESDFTFSGDATAKGTDIGTYAMGLTAGQFTNTNPNFTNVKFVVTDGSLTITKMALTITADDATQVYNGQALTKDSFTNTDLAAGDAIADVTVTGSQTVVGESANVPSAAIIKDGDKDVTANYDITYENGTLKVTPLETVIVTITENNGSFMYDGTEKTVEGYTVAISDPLYTEADFEFKGDAAVKATDFGTYDMELKAEDFVNTNANFDKVTFVIVDGQLEITKRAVTLTSATASKTYDSQPLQAMDVTVTGDGFVEGEGAAYSDFASITNVGSTDNTFTYTLNDNTKADNYTITVVEGLLTVAKKGEVVVTITENSGTEQYDGTEKTVAGYTVSISDPLYTEADFSFSGNNVVKATDAGTYEMELKAEDFANINTNFDDVTFVIVDGQLEITKRAVTLTSATASKTYDGEALQALDITVSGDGWAEGEGAAYSEFASITEVGSVDNTFTYTLNDNTKADNYVIDVVEGTLTVNKLGGVTVTITEHSGEFVYDSTEKTVSGYDVAISDPLYTVDDFTFSGNASVSGTDVGTYEMELKAEDFANTNANFSDVTFVIVDGELVITKKAVTITAGSATKVYDGTELICKDYTAEGLAEGDTVDSVAITGSQTEVGKSDNVAATVVIKDGTKVVTNNYEVTYVKGELEVTPLKNVKVIITENSDSVVYNGAEQSVEGYTVSIENALYSVEDFTFSGSDIAAGKNVGTYDMELTAEDFTNTNPNFEDVIFEIVDGQLEITKMALTITAASGEKIYDGTPLTDAGYENTVLALGDAIESVSVVGSQTFVGSSANVASAAVIKDGDEDVTANYDITYVDGTLTVTKKGGIVVTITENSGEYTYDATEKTVEGYTVAINSTLYTVEDFTFSGEAIVKGTDAGLYPMELKAEDFANVNENFEDVTFVIVDGTLTIKARPITVTVNGNTDTKVYNGAEQSVEGYTVDIADTLYTEEDIAFTGKAVAKGTDVGTYAMGLTTEQFANTNENFIVTFVVNDGSLEITPLTGVVVTITENSGEFVYDGTVKTVEGYTVATSSELYTEADFTFSGNDSVSGTYVGAYDMELKAEDFANINDNFADVIFQIVDGQLVITPVQTAIVITADSNEKVYDGTALTDDGFTYTQGVLMAGDYITAVVEGSQTDVGSSANKVTSFKVLRDTGSVAREIVDVTANYANITTEDGTLTVTKRPVTLTSGSDSKVYDGTALTKEEVTVTGDGFVEGEGAAYSQFASITEVGSTNNTFTYTLTEGTKAENYDITVVEGVLTVNKHTDAKLEATGYTGVYDGQLHDGVTDKAVVGGVEGDEWTYTYSIDGENFVEEMPQYQDVGTYTVYVKASNPNYEGDALTTTVPVVITPATIVVTADDHTIATGDPDPELTYQVSTPVATETPAFDGVLVREEGNAKGEYAIEQGTLVLVDGEGFKASNYVLEYVPGTLTILQRAIDVEKTVDVEKAFVGDTITYTFVVTNTGEVDLETVVLVDEMLQIAGEIGALAIGESWTGTATYVAAAEDVGKTLINTVIVAAEGDTTDQDDSEGTVIYAPVPQTGDEMPLGLLSGAMLVSLAGVIVLLLSQRKNKADQAE